MKTKLTLIIGATKFIPDLGLGDLFTSSDVNRAIGIVRTNGIETSASADPIAKVRVRARQETAKKLIFFSLHIFIGECRTFRSLFPNVSLLSHSCVCNARCVQLEDHAIEIR